MTRHNTTRSSQKAPPKACVIGYPIHHSRSPLIHSHWLQQNHINGHYGIESISPAALAGFLSDVKTGQSVYQGGNATLPHKERLLSLADQADDMARLVGAANTFWVVDGQLHVTNTDVYGFLANLDAHSIGAPWDQPIAGPKKAVVLGAGGAARAVIVGLIQRGFEDIVVINRTLQRAERLCDAFGAVSVSPRPNLSPVAWADAGLCHDRACLLVNTTSLGMQGQPELRYDLTGLPLDALVTDIVYHPLQTDLLRKAAARGHRTIDGLGMLLHQAVPGFEMWFGVRPQVTAALRDLIVQDMAT